MEVKTFRYGSEDVGSGENTFDQIWESEWSRVEKEGLLRYSQPRTNPNLKMTTHPFRFAFQYLHDRGVKRRSRVQFDSVNEPFSQERFHFGKVSEREILFQFKNDSRRRGKSQSRTVAIVNVSPIEWGHFLLVPDLEDNLPQQLTHRAVTVALEMMNLTQNIHFRMMYNSLLGWASVNHLHFHCYSFPAELVLDNLSSVDFHGSIRLISPSYPVPGFVINIGIEEIATGTDNIITIVNILHELNCAHNVVIVKGVDDSCDPLATTRFYIFPRVHADTAVVSQCVDPACVEFSGQFPCKGESEWSGLTGEGAVQLLSTVKIEVDLFERVKKMIRERILLA